MENDTTGKKASLLSIAAKALSGAGTLPPEENRRVLVDLYTGSSDLSEFLVREFRISTSDEERYKFDDTDIGEPPTYALFGLDQRELGRALRKENCPRHRYRLNNSSSGLLLRRFDPAQGLCEN